MALRECTTAEEVLENARRTQARIVEQRKPKPVLTVVEPEPEPIPVPEPEPVQEQVRLLSPYPKIREIIVLVARYYNVTRIDIISQRRSRTIAFPRHVGFYLARTLTPCSLPEIGKAFDKDHTTVLHGVQKITRLREEDHELRGSLELLSAKLMEGRHVD